MAALLSPTRHSLVYWDLLPGLSSEAGQVVEALAQTWQSGELRDGFSDLIALAGRRRNGQARCGWRGVG